MRGDGSRFSAEVSVSPIRDAAGAVIGMVGHAARRDRAARRRGGRRDAAGDRRRRHGGDRGRRPHGRHPVLQPVGRDAVRLERRGGDRQAGDGADRRAPARPGCRRCVEALAAGKTVHREGVALRRDGSHLEAELNASPIMGADGRVRGTALIVLDISERRRTQRMLDRIVEHAPTSIAVKDLEGRYLLYGERGAGVIGRRSEDIVGRTDHEVFAAQRRGPARRAGQARARLRRPAHLRGDAARARRAGLRLRHHPLPAARAGRQDRGARA